jgi:hypothetical protein
VLPPPSGDSSSSNSSGVVVELSGGSGPTSGCPSVMTLTPGGGPAAEDGGGYFPPSNLSTPSRDLGVGGSGPLLLTAVAPAAAVAPVSDGNSVVGRTPIKSEPGSSSGSSSNITTTTPGTTTGIHCPAGLVPHEVHSIHKLLLAGLWIRIRIQ